MKTLSILLALSFSIEAFSAVTISGISGGSNIEGFGVNKNASIEVYAGVYGDESACSSSSSTSLCDSCSTSFSPCNSSRIHQSLTLNITFQTDTTATTTNPIYPIAYIEEGTNGTKIEFTDSQLDQNPITTNTTQISASITWAEICNKWNSSSTCKFNDSTTLVIGFTTLPSGSTTDLIDSSKVTRLIVQGDDTGLGTNPVSYCSDPTTATGSSGACNFVAYPGDGKVFIEDISAPSGFPSTGGSVNFNAVRIYYELDNNPVDPTASFADLKVNETQSGTAIDLTENTIEGLDNDASYKFRMASVDQAGNVAYFTFDGDDSVCVPDKSITEGCHEAVPESVIGLLEGETDCFIATASFGSPFEKHVKDLRKFRTRYLQTHFFGRKLIHFYYQNSPPIAHWIRKHPSVKPLIRLALWPFWFFAKLSLQYGPLALLGLLALFFSFLFLRVHRRRVKRA